MEENKKSLKSLFEQGKETLAKKLESLSLPRDTQKVQDFVSCHMNGLLDSKGEYRQSLTQSEEFVLLSAMNLLQAQQAMIEAVSVRNNNKNHSAKTESTYSKKGNVSKEHTPIIVGGTAVGGVTGALIFNTWGTLFGAIAGTAVALYYTFNQDPNPQRGQTSSSTEAKPSEDKDKIDVNAFLTIVSKICEKVDGIMKTYRVQVRHIRNTYEQKEKPTLQSDYGMLLDQIANVCRVCEGNKNSLPATMQNAIGLLEECLENYGLSYNNGKITTV